MLFKCWKSVVKLTDCPDMTSAVMRGSTDVLRRSNRLFLNVLI